FGLLVTIHTASKSEQRDIIQFTSEEIFNKQIFCLHVTSPANFWMTIYVMSYREILNLDSKTYRKLVESLRDGSHNKNSDIVDFNKHGSLVLK
ncbi:hypothetical protein BgiBS90_017535, partial [Biomphalaria glabrata]